MGPIEAELRRAPCTSQYAAWDWLTRPDGCEILAFHFANSGNPTPSRENGADSISEAIEAAEALGL